MRLRDVEPGDVDAYVRMRCDPVLTAETGGPMRREDVADKVRRDVAEVAAGGAWILMVLAGPDDREVAGTVTVWRHDEAGEPVSEIGWMLLPEHQGQGLARAAVREVLDRERVERRWGELHAYPSVTNERSNALCRAVGFRLVGRREVQFGEVLRPAFDWAWSAEATAGP
jgi:RimJ/RimL family protein N-acetyltransferase